MTKGSTGSGKGSASGVMPGGDKKSSGGANDESNRVTSGLPTGGAKGGSK